MGKGYDKTTLWHDGTVLTVEDGSKVKVSKITLLSAGNSYEKPAVLLDHSELTFTKSRIIGSYSHGIYGFNSAVRINSSIIGRDGPYGTYLLYDKDPSSVTIEGNIFAQEPEKAIYLRAIGKDPFVLRNNEIIQGNILIRDNIFRERNPHTTPPDAIQTLLNNFPRNLYALVFFGLNSDFPSPSLGTPSSKGLVKSEQTS